MLLLTLNDEDYAFQHGDYYNNNNINNNNDYICTDSYIS